MKTPRKLLRRKKDEEHRKNEITQRGNTKLMYSTTEKKPSHLARFMGVKSQTKPQFREGRGAHKNQHEQKYDNIHMSVRVHMPGLMHSVV